MPILSGHKLARQDTLQLLQQKDATLRLHLFVGIPGLEPGMTGPESVVLPLHHSPIIFVCGCKDTNILGIQNISTIFFAKIPKLTFQIKASPLKNTKIK